MKKTVKAWAVIEKGWIFKLGTSPCVFKSKKEALEYYPFGEQYLIPCTITYTVKGKRHER